MTGDVVLPAPFTVGVGATTPPVVTVAPTEAGWAWQVVERVQGGVPHRRYVTVPDSVSVLNYADLVEVDPATLDPVTLSSAWWTQVTNYVTTTFVPKWKPNTAYAAGDPVVNPSGQLVTANTTFTSGATYTASNWTVTGGGGGANAADLGFDLLLLMGQSNMQGNNTATGSFSGSTFDARTDPADGRIFTYDWAGTYGGMVASALDPLNHPGGATGVGPGMAFGRWYATTQPANRKILLVPVAVTGTSLGATSGNTWNPEITGSLYDQAVTQARAALTAAGANARVAAALWIQGEQDTALGISTPTATYQTLLKELVGQLRADLTLPTLPFIIGGMVPEFISQGATQAAIAGVHAAIPAAVRYTAYVAGPSGFQKGDNLHYTPAGQRILGRNMAAAYGTAVANASTPVAPVPGSRGPAATPPGQVTGLAAGTPTSTTVPLTWTAVTGATSYKVEQSTNGGTSWSVSTTSGSGTALTVTGLTASTAYSFRVSAVNATGTGTPSSTVTATTAAGSADFGPTLSTGSGTPTIGAGKFGNALVSGSRVTTAGLAGIRTLEAWVKTTATGVAVATGAASPNLWLGTNGGSAFIGMPNGNNLQTSVVINDNAWHHVALTIDATVGAIVWVDGVTAGTDSAVTAAQTITAGTAFGVGAQGTNAFPWTGGVDEVRVSTVVRYTTAFTPAGPFTTDGNTLALYHLES